MNHLNLEELVIHHEGFRDKAYKCTEGHLTIGVGHKILPEDSFKEGVVYNKEQLMAVFRTDLANAKFYANLLVKGWDIPEVAYNVIVSMIFQMGATGVGKFKNFLLCRSFSKRIVKSSTGFFKVSGIKLPPNLPPQNPFLSC